MNSAGLCLSFEASEQSEQSIAPCLCPRLLADTMADNFECQLEIGVPFYPFEWLCSKAPPICVGPYLSWDSSFEAFARCKHGICDLYLLYIWIASSILIVVAVFLAWRILASIKVLLAGHLCDCQMWHSLGRYRWFHVG